MIHAFCDFFVIKKKDINLLLFPFIDVNECVEGIHSCLEGTEECRNIDGAYECDVKCDEGFIYSVNLGTCIGNYFQAFYDLLM